MGRYAKEYSLIFFFMAALGFSEDLPVQLFGTKAFVVLDSSYRYSEIDQRYYSQEKKVSVSGVRGVEGGYEKFSEGFLSKYWGQQVPFSGKWKVLLKNQKQLGPNAWTIQFLVFLGDDSETAGVYITYVDSHQTSVPSPEATRLIQSLSWRSEADFHWESGTFFRDDALSKLKFVALGLNAVFSTSGKFSLKSGAVYRIGYSKSSLELSGNERAVVGLIGGYAPVEGTVISPDTLAGISGERITEVVTRKSGKQLRRLTAVPYRDGFCYIEELSEADAKKDDTDFEAIVANFRFTDQNSP